MTAPPSKPITTVFGLCVIGAFCFINLAIVSLGRHEHLAGPGVILSCEMLLFVVMALQQDFSRGFVVVALLALQAVALCLERLTGLLPCDVACQGGSHYQTIFGVSVIYPALVAYLLWLGLIWRDGRRGSWSTTTVSWSALLAGTSLFYLWVAWLLRLTCPFCLFLHMNVLIALLGFIVLAPSSTWRPAGVWMIIGFLTMNQLFHHSVVADVAVGATPAKTEPGTPAHHDDATADQLRASPAYHVIDFGRRRGSGTARYRIDVVIDPHCRMCAEEFDSLQTLLLPYTKAPAPDCQLVTVFLQRPSDASAIDLDRHLLAAAFLGQERFRILLDVLLGSPEHADFAAMRSRIAQIDDPEALQAAFLKQRTVIDQLLADDAARLQRCAVGATTPTVLLFDTSNANPGDAQAQLVKRWQGQLDMPELSRQLHQIFGR